MGDLSGLNRNKYQGLSGPAGLFIAVIAEATIDATGKNGPAHCIDALAYFAGDNYKNHLAWLGLPSDWRPELIEVKPCQKMSKKTTI